MNGQNSRFLPRASGLPCAAGAAGCRWAGSVSRTAVAVISR